MKTTPRPISETFRAGFEDAVAGMPNEAHRYAGKEWTEYTKGYLAGESKRTRREAKGQY